MYTRSYIRSRSGSRNGIALIAVLVFIVLLTILTVSYISFTGLNRLSSTSYCKAIQAQEVAQGGMQDILSDLHNEIIAGSIKNPSVYTQGGVTIYLPATNLTAVPARIGYVAANYNVTNATPTQVATSLVRVSRATNNSGATFFTSWATSPYTNNQAALPGGLPILDRASQVSTAVASVDGRTISAARWNKSYLLATNSASVPSVFTTTPPDWVYVTRTGSRTCLLADLPSMKPSNNVTTVYAATGPGVTPTASPVLGRYAFVIYDEGALIDATLAGSPSTVMNNSVAVTPLPTFTNSAAATPPTPTSLALTGKSYLAFADLMQLPGFAGGGATAQTTIDTFVNWRNAGGSAYAIANNGASTGANAYLGAIFDYAQNGFLSFLKSGTSSDSPLLGRQDLINYFASIDPNINTSKATFSQALPYFGTFSRAVSAPSWTPTLNSNQDPNFRANLIPATKQAGWNQNTGPVLYKTNAETAGNANRDLANVRFANTATITHYPDDGTVSPTTLLSLYSYSVTAGDPLLQNRFSLAKINWLSQPWAGQTDPGTTSPTYASSNYPAAIQACFGLVWGAPGSTTTNSTTSTSTANGGNPCWNYVGSPVGSGGTTQTNPLSGTIETMDQIAKENREPNFFELLKAAVLSGSIGLGPGLAVFNNGANQSSSYGEGYHDFGNPSSSSDQVGTPGLFSGTLKTLSSAGPPAPATIADIQIIQIGANIIDQYDADSYPTAIYFPYLSASTLPGGGAQPTFDPVAGNGGAFANALYGPVTMVYGDENLPLLNKIASIACSPDASNNDPSTTGGQTADESAVSIEGWLQPELWNPHQQPASSLPNAPLNFQIRAYGSAYLTTHCTEYDPLGKDYGSGSSNPPVNVNLVSSAQLYYHGQSSLEGPSSGQNEQAGTIAFSVTSGALAFYDTPHLLVTDMPTSTAGIPGVTVNPSYGLSFSTAAQPTSYAQSNFPYYSTAVANLNPSSFPSYTNHFAAFSAQVAGVQSPSQSTPPPQANWHVSGGDSSNSLSPDMDSVSVDFPLAAAWTTPTPAGAFPSMGASFALGWIDSNNAFHPYSFISGLFIEEVIGKGGGAPAMVGSVLQKPNVTNAISYAPADARTSRFAHTFNSDANYNANSNLFSSNNGNSVCDVTIPAYNSKAPFITPPNFGSPLYASQYTLGLAFPQGWMSNTIVPPPSAGGKLSSATPANTAALYADPDGVVRPGDSAGGTYYYINPATGTAAICNSATGLNLSTGDGAMLFTSPGMPTGSNPDTTDSTNVQHGRRPIILNRPFRSVGELGYVFRDEPFKTLDFFSPSSADAALLDVFSLTDESKIGYSHLISVVAGQVDLSNATQPIIRAILTGGSKKDLDPAYNLGTEGQTIAKNIANALNPIAGPQPLINRAALVTQVQPDSIAALASATFNSGDMGNKAYLEAPVRALSDVTNTRTWNLLIDIIAQSGQMSSSASSLKDFVVQGERRYWLHIAIDRYTGKIIDQQLEPVYE